LPLPISCRVVELGD